MKHKIHNFQKIIAICFTFCSLIQCQNYLWPVKAEKALTAVFAEERPGRYHTGIDIRTFGEIGYPLQAIENGYVSRIQTSSKKYGKTCSMLVNSIEQAEKWKKEGVLLLNFSSDVSVLMEGYKSAIEKISK